MNISFLISLVVLIPFFGFGIAILLPSKTFAEIEKVKQICFVNSVATFAVSIVIWANFEESDFGYQYIANENTGFSKLNLGIDELSLWFVLLTTLLTPICLLASWKNVKNQVALYFGLQLLVAGVLTSVFVVVDLLLFYVTFETVLMPLFIIVGLWGGSPTRVRSALLLFLYTLAGSLFMLLSIMVIYTQTPTKSL